MSVTTFAWWTFQLSSGSASASWSINRSLAIDSRRETRCRLVLSNTKLPGLIQGGFLQVYECSFAGKPRTFLFCWMFQICYQVPRPGPCNWYAEFCQDHQALPGLGPSGWLLGRLLWFAYPIDWDRLQAQIGLYNPPTKLNHCMGLDGHVVSLDVERMAVWARRKRCWKSAKTLLLRVTKQIRNVTFVLIGCQCNVTVTLFWFKGIEVFTQFGKATSVTSRIKQQISRQTQTCILYSSIRTLTLERDPNTTMW